MKPFSAVPDNIMIRAYLKYDVPSDTINGSPSHQRKFRDMLGPGYKAISPSWLGRRLVTIRKAGNLPRIRDGHGPRKRS